MPDRPNRQSGAIYSSVDYKATVRVIAAAWREPRRAWAILFVYGSGAMVIESLCSRSILKRAKKWESVHTSSNEVHQLLLIQAPWRPFGRQGACAGRVAGWLSLMWLPRRPSPVLAPPARTPERVLGCALFSHRARQCGRPRVSQ